MNKIISLALVCSALLACSGSVTIMPEDESLGTTTTSSDTAPTTQPPDSDGGSGDAGGGDVVGGSGGEGGVVTDGGAPEGGSPPDECSTGALSVKLDSNTPQSAIVIGGSDWVEVARYVVSNATDKAIKISYAEVTQMDPNGDVADFTEVALSSGYALHLIGSKVSDDGTSFVLTEEKSGGLVIPPAESVSVEVAAKIAPVLSSSAAGGKWYSVPRSGHTPALSFERYRIEGEAADVSHKTCATKPQSMVVRKSKPIVTKLALQSSVLANTDLDLIKFQVTADNAGPIGVREIRLNYTKTIGLAISNLRIRRGTTDIENESAHVFVEGGFVIHATTTSAIAHIVFKSEETISGSGNVYTIHGDVTGATSGQSITFTFDHDDGNGTPFTGYVGYCYYNAYLTEFPFNPDNACNQNVGNAPTAGFIWSDMSEVPHSLASRDWTSALFVEDLSESQVLSL